MNWDEEEKIRKYIKEKILSDSEIREYLAVDNFEDALEELRGIPVAISLLDVPSMIPIGLNADSLLARYLYLAGVNILPKVEEIPNYMFFGITEGWSNKIVIPENIDRIGEKSFMNSSLESISFSPVNDLTIDYEAFYGCRWLKEVHLPRESKDWRFGFWCFPANTIIHGYWTKEELNKIVDEANPPYGTRISTGGTFINIDTGEKFIYHRINKYPYHIWE